MFYPSLTARACLENAFCIYHDKKCFLPGNSGWKHFLSFKPLKPIVTAKQFLKSIRYRNSGNVKLLYPIFL